MNNHCRKARRLLALRAADRSAAEQDYLDVHVQNCPDCAAWARQCREQDALIGGLPPVRPSSLKSQRFLAQIQTIRRQHTMFAQLKPVFSVAAMVAFLVALVLGMRLILPMMLPDQDVSPATGATPPVLQSITPTAYLQASTTPAPQTPTPVGETPQPSATPIPLPPTPTLPALVPETTRTRDTIPYEVIVHPQLPPYTLILQMSYFDEASKGYLGEIYVYREGALLQTLTLENVYAAPALYCQNDGTDCPVASWLDRLRVEDINFDGYMDIGYDILGGAYWSTPDRWLFDATSGTFYTNAFTEKLSEIAFSTYTLHPQFREIRFIVGSATLKVTSVYIVTEDETLALMSEQRMKSDKEGDVIVVSSYFQDASTMTDPMFTDISEAQLPPKLWWSLATTISQTLATPAYDIVPLSWERVNWPDSCLGLPGDSCEAGAVSGYRIQVSVGDREYTYHCTVSEPYNFLLADEEQSKVPDIGNPTLIFERGDPTYWLRLVVNDAGQAVISGYDDDRLLVSTRLSEVRISQLAERVARFTSFQSENLIPDIRGALNFRGQGASVSPAWQRAMTRWVGVIWDEVWSPNQVHPIRESALYWQLPEMSDRPGYCGRLIVTTYGQAKASVEPCVADAPGGREDSGWSLLETDEWEAFDAWLSEYDYVCFDIRPNCSETGNEGTACETPSGLSCFLGLGEQAISEESLAELELWAEQVFARLTAH